MIDLLTKEELVKCLETTDRGIYLIYGVGSSGKTTFIKELQKKFNVSHAPIGRLTRPKAKNLKSMPFPVLVECNHYPTQGAHEFISGIVRFDAEA